MRTVETKIYEIQELSSKAREKAINNLRHTNVCHDWRDYTLECLCIDLGKIGVIIGYDDIQFSLDRDRSLYCYSKNIEINKKYAYDNWQDDITTKFGVYANHTGGGMMSGLKGSDTGKVTNQRLLLKLEKVQEIFCDYWEKLYKEHEYLTSDEAIIEIIECNEYEFHEDGSMA